MPNLDVDVSRLDMDRLMDVAGVLRDLTRELRAMRDIPPFLTATLALGPVSLALVKRGASGPPEIFFLACSAGPQAEPAAQKTLLDALNQPNNPGFTGHDLASLGATTQVPLPDGHGHATMLQRQVNSDHRLILLVQPRPDGPPHAGQIALLSLVANYLSREVRALLMWETGPEQLGDPFDRLTSREWVVLSGLSSEDGEKQLADRLGLSPHTLHSHIKAIYRKIGVQGRLPLLQKLNHALCQHRMLILKPGADPLRATVNA